MEPLDRASAAIDQIELLLSLGDPSRIKSQTIRAALGTFPTILEVAAIRWLWWQSTKSDFISMLNIDEDLLARLPRVLPPVNRLDQAFVNDIRAADREIFSINGISSEWDDDSPFTSFQARFRDSMLRKKFSEDTAYKMLVALKEMAANAVEHSMCSMIVASYQVLDSFCSFSVTDIGCGARESIARNHAAAAEMKHDVDALQLILREGVSCTGMPNRGYGFSDMFKRLADRMSVIRLRSVGAGAKWHGRGPAQHAIEFVALPYRIGFHVSVASPISQFERA
jgi:anti-sigma regulatory factor (Ser/Thr protein kinase)